MDSARKRSASETRNISNSIQKPPPGIQIFNEKLARLKTLATYLLAEQKDGRILFYHIRSFSADKISQALMQLYVENFTMNRARMKGELVSEHNEM